jgi:hypothetical protein
MDYMVVISAVVLGLSVLATLAKFLDWFIHSDPRTMIRTTRWMLLLLLVACIPLLIMAIANQQWSFAMLIGALRDERRGSRDRGERSMSRGEALEVLGLEPGADEAEIRAAHKRLLRLVHPDHGGSAYLAKRVYQARDTLLDLSSKSVTRTGDDERA